MRVEHDRAAVEFAADVGGEALLAAAGAAAVPEEACCATVRAPKKSLEKPSAAEEEEGRGCIAVLAAEAEGGKAEVEVPPVVSLLLKVPPRCLEASWSTKGTSHASRATAPMP